jgi:hypothetical protein
MRLSSSSGRTYTAGPLEGPGVFSFGIGSIEEAGNDFFLKGKATLEDASVLGGSEGLRARGGDDVGCCEGSSSSTSPSSGVEGAGRLDGLGDGVRDAGRFEAGETIVSGWERKAWLLFEGPAFIPRHVFN